MAVEPLATEGMGEVDATFDEGGRLARTQLSGDTRRALEVDVDPAPAGPAGAPAPDAPERRRRSLRSDLGRVAGTPARRGRLVVGLVVLAVVVAGPLMARASVSDARTAARAGRSERAGAADALADVEAAEERAITDDATAAALADVALEARNEQRRRLAALGLNEETIDAYLDQYTDNVELVEWRRDETTAEVDRQAAEIPQMQECMRVASQTINRAFNLIFDPDAPVPPPSEQCLALVAAAP